MVFDVETTGLIPKRDPIAKFSTNIDTCPFILQLSFIIYDTTIAQVIREFNSYIKIHDTVVISQKITQITGITSETCKSLGVPIEDALVEFFHEYIRCDKIIAHNIAFDREMILLEITRNYSKLIAHGCNNPEIIFNDIYNFINHKQMVCTMTTGKSLCNILVETSNKKTYQKYPKLSELHFKLFNVIPDGLHDALVDSSICLACYLKMTEN